ncbi:hypothetical protein ACFE04_014972 [Oxalis oulophora]
MKMPLKQNVIYTLSRTSICISRLNNLHYYNYHTKAELNHQLKNCNNLLSSTSEHANIVKLGFINDTFTANNLINCYVRCREIEHGRKLFDEMAEPNVVSWTSLIAGYVNAGCPKKALFLFGKLVEGGNVMPNEFTLATVINSCSVLAHLEVGKKIHARVEIMGFQGNLVVCSSLIDMYGKCNDVEMARRVFDSMEGKNVVSWTSMVTAYAQNGKGYEALEIFREFNGKTKMVNLPNQFMLTSVVSACASLGKLIAGKVTHGAVIRRGYFSINVVATSLVDMYAKCGFLNYSLRVFSKISNPCMIAYTSMIAGAAKFGHGKLSLELFEEMISRNIKPSSVTFVGVLHACSHSGLVEKGLGLLDSMTRKYGIVPDSKHYTCVVDMLGRVGRLDEAYRLAKSISVGPDDGALLWGTLLSASRLQGRVDIATEASKWLIAANQQVAAAYVTLSNAHALAGNWEHAHGLRSQMKHNGIYKKPGCSWVEIKDSTYLFYAGDLSCDRGSELLKLLRELEKKMKMKGYVGGSKDLVFVDVEEEAKDEMVSLHSERLALAFALLMVPKGVSIRVMKNLRMCRDCHEAFKMISEITERDIIVRDVNRFHHFTNGCCTCKDFW